MITRPTKAAAISGIGWSNGMAAQLSLPNMLRLRPWGYARIRVAGLWAGPGREFLRDDLLEKLGIGRAESEGICVDALLGKSRIALGIEDRTRIARALDPGGELLRRHRLDVEMHFRETIATVVARLARGRGRGGRASGQL